HAYALGAVAFTGAMPVIVGADGPDLGGFVCPATIVRAERWKIGQLKPGDRVRFRCVSFGEARERERAQSEWIRTLSAQGAFATTATQSIARSNVRQSRSE